MIKLANRIESPISKLKAAVYQKTPAPWLPSKPKFLTLVIVLQIFAIAISSEWRDTRVAWFVFGIFVTIAAWLAMRWRIYSSVFITPPRS